MVRLYTTFQCSGVWEHHLSRSICTVPADNSNPRISASLNCSVDEVDSPSQRGPGFAFGPSVTRIPSKRITSRFSSNVNSFAVIASPHLMSLCPTSSKRSRVEATSGASHCSIGNCRCASSIPPCSTRSRAPRYTTSSLLAVGISDMQKYVVLGFSRI